MNGSAAASNRAAAAASFSFGDEDATDNDRDRAQVGLISAKTFNYFSRLGTFLRGTLLSTEKPVKTQKDEITHQKEM